VDSYKRMVKAIERARHYQSLGAFSLASAAWSTVARHRRTWQETRPTERRHSSTDMSTGHDDACLCGAPLDDWGLCDYCDRGEAREFRKRTGCRTRTNA